MLADFSEAAVEQLSALGVLGGVGVDLVVLALVVGERVWGSGGGETSSASERSF